MVVPGKNIRSLAGRLLLAFSIELGQKILEIHTMFVSADDDRIV